MDFEFPPDTLMLRDMLQRFVKKEAQPLEMKYFTAGSLSPEERTRLRRSIEQMGLWGITVPEEYGGGGLDLVTSCMIEEELGGTFIPIEIGDVPSILYACRDNQVGAYLEAAVEGSRRPILAVREPGESLDRTAGGLKTQTTGIRPESWSTTAVPDEEVYVLNGRKVLGISPEPDDFYILIAKSGVESQAGELTAFLLDANCDGLSLTKNGEVCLSIKDCRAGPDSILGQAGGALAAGAEEAPKLVIRTGARYVGIVERLLDMAREHARDWVMFGAPLSTRPAVQRMLAEMRVDVESWNQSPACRRRQAGQRPQVGCPCAPGNRGNAAARCGSCDHDLRRPRPVSSNRTPTPGAKPGAPAGFRNRVGFCTLGDRLRNDRCS